MDFSLSAEERMIVDTARNFAQREIAPLLGQVQQANIANEQFPDQNTRRQLQRKARDIGLWGLNTKPEFGGAGLGALLSTLVNMETARTLVPFEYGGMVLPSLYAANAEQTERYLRPTANGERTPAFALTEPDAGSDATRIQLRAVKSGDKWILNGTKTWISQGEVADYAIVFALTDVEKRHRGGITAFLVDRDMGWTSKPISVMALPGQGETQTSELSFIDVEVPESNILGELGNGFQLAAQTLGSIRLRVAAIAIGQAQRLLELAIDYANTRTTFGKPIAEYQAIQWMIADSAVEIEAAKWLALHAAWLADQGHRARYEVAISKLFSTQMVWNVVDRVMQIHGAMGYSKELPIERLMREVRVYRIYEGSDEIQKRTIARELLSGAVDLSTWA